MAANALYKLAYDEALRVLTEQEVVIDGLRSRAGVLFSAAAITTSFLGAQALHGVDWSLFAWPALVAFVGVAAAILAILWPRRWEFAADPYQVIETYIEASEPVALEDLHRELSFHLHASYQENRVALERLFVYFQVANVVFAIELILWIAAIATTA